MVNRHAAKGDRFERETIGYLRNRLGGHLARPRPGALDDRGDIAGIPGWTLEVKCWADMVGAINAGLGELEVEQGVTGTRYGLVIVKRARIADPARQLAVMPLSMATTVMADSLSWQAVA